MLKQLTLSSEPHLLHPVLRYLPYLPKVPTYLPPYPRPLARLTSGAHSTSTTLHRAPFASPLLSRPLPVPPRLSFSSRLDPHGVWRLGLASSSSSSSSSSPSSSSLRRSRVRHNKTLREQAAGEDQSGLASAAWPLLHSSSSRTVVIRTHRLQQTLAEVELPPSSNRPHTSPKADLPNLRQPHTSRSSSRSSSKPRKRPLKSTVSSTLLPRVTSMASM